MAAWAPFRAKLAARAKDYTVGWSPTETFGVSTFTGAEFWGQARARGAPASSFDPKEPNRAFFWPDNLVEIGLYWCANDYKHVLMEKDNLKIFTIAP